MNPKSSNSCKRQRERVAQIRERFIPRITREFEQNFGATSLLREFKRYLLLTTSFVLANFLLKKFSLFLGRVLCCSVVDSGDPRFMGNQNFLFSHVHDKINNIFFHSITLLKIYYLSYSKTTAKLVQKKSDVANQSSTERLGSLCANLGSLLNSKF